MHLGAIHQLSNLLYLSRRQLNIQRAQVLLQILNLLRSWNREDVISLRHQPRQRQLTSRAPLLPRQLLDAVHQPQVLREVLLAETRGELAEVALLKVGGGFVLAGEDAAAERRIGDGGDAELATGGKERDLGLLDVGGERRVLDLHGVDVVDLFCAAQRVRGDL